MWIATACALTTSRVCNWSQEGPIAARTITVYFNSYGYGEFSSYDSVISISSWSDWTYYEHAVADQVRRYGQVPSVQSTGASAPACTRSSAVLSQDAFGAARACVWVDLAPTVW